MLNNLDSTLNNKNKMLKNVKFFFSNNGRKKKKKKILYKKNSLYNYNNQVYLKKINLIKTLKDKQKPKTLKESVKIFLKKSYSITPFSILLNTFICLLIISVNFNNLFIEYEKTLNNSIEESIKELFSMVYNIDVNLKKKDQYICIKSGNQYLCTKGVNRYTESFTRCFLSIINIIILTLALTPISIFIWLFKFHEIAPNLYYLKILCPVLISPLIIDWRRSIFIHTNFSIPWIVTIPIIVIPIFLIWTFIFQSSIRYHFYKKKEHCIITTLYISSYSQTFLILNKISICEENLSKSGLKFFFKKPFIFLKKFFLKQLLKIHLYFLKKIKSHFFKKIKNLLKPKYFFLLKCEINQIKKYKLNIELIKNKNRRYKKYIVTLIKYLNYINIIFFLFYPLT